MEWEEKPAKPRLASAGAFIMQAAHVAAMASGTNVRAAHPVVASGRDLPDDDMKKKVVNDLGAQMRSLTQLRGRNQSAAQRMIEDSLSLTAHEALAEGAIDLVADDRAFLAAFSRLHLSKDFTITLSVTLRYFPTMAEEWNYIKEFLKPCSF